MKKFILGMIVALLVCATGIFAGMGSLNEANDKPVNEKDPVFSLPEGGLPIA